MTKPSVAPDGTAVALLVTELLVPLGNRTAMIDVRTVDDAAGHSVVDAIQAATQRYNDAVKLYKARFPAQSEGDPAPQPVPPIAAPKTDG